MELNHFAGRRVQWTCHAWTIGNQQRYFELLLFEFRAFSTKYLGNALQCCHLACLDETANPTVCLEAAINSSCIRSTERAGALICQVNRTSIP